MHPFSSDQRAHPLRREADRNRADEVRMRDRDPEAEAGRREPGAIREALEGWLTVPTLPNDQRRRHCQRRWH